MADGDSDEEQVMDAETDKRVDAALDNDEKLCVERPFI